MSFEDSQVGNLTSGTYWEYTHRNGRDSPRSSMQGIPPAYVDWNPYFFDKRSFLGWMARISRDPPTSPAFQPSYWASAWECGERYGISVTSDPNPTIMLNDLIQKYRQSDFNLGVAMVEGKESADMIVGRLQSMLYAARALKRGNLGGATRHLFAVPRSHRKKAARKLQQGDVSGSWLELYLGWSPMINDIYAAADLIKPMKKTNLIKTKRRPGQASITAGGGTALGDTQAQYHARIVAEMVSEPTIYQRLGLTNPADIAWEAIPFSFVVDYFVPIGTYIATLEAPFLDVGRIMTQRYMEVKGSRPPRPKGYQISPGQWLYDSTPGSTMCYRKYWRELTSVSGLMACRRLNFRLPRKLEQIGNMAALLHQALLGMKPRHAVSG